MTLARAISPDRILVPLVAFLVTATASVVAQDPVRIDVKTKLVEKFTLTSLKNGAVFFLDESDWATTVELDEDHALWIRNAVREETADSIVVAFDLELREPATFEEGELRASRSVRIAYPRSAAWREHAPASAQELVDEIELYAGIGLDAVRIFAPRLASVAVTRALELVEGELPGGSLDAAKVEAMIAGARIAYEARQMVDEVKEATAARSTQPAETGN